jgi:hypothetical protein
MKTNQLFLKTKENITKIYVMWEWVHSSFKKWNIKKAGPTDERI